MIVWCSYCQQMIGEREPLTSYEVTHGLCRRCRAQLSAGEELVEARAPVIRYFQDLFAAARAGDRRTCEAMAARAASEGYRPVDVMVGLLQPALAAIGNAWEAGEVTTADEHRFTAWCEAMLARLELWAAPEGPLDLLIVPAPGNLHLLGPRLAEQALLAYGVRALAIVPELPVDELAALAAARPAAWVGLSCAMTSMVDAALATVAELRRRGYRGGAIVSGQAVRRGEPPRTGDVAVCATIADARVLICGE